MVKKYLKSTKEMIPGFVLAIIICLMSKYVGVYTKKYLNLEALTVALILGMIFNNSIKTPKACYKGTNFLLKYAMRLGIILLGFKLDIMGIFQMGWKLILLVIIFVPMTILLTREIGKPFKLNSKLSTLIGVGSCICGTSAVLAMAPCIGASEEDTSVAATLASFLGVVAVLIYTVIGASAIPINDNQFGIWAGLTLPGIAHTIAVAFTRGDQALEIGTFVKMFRILMLIPVSMTLSVVFGVKGGKRKIAIPYYVIFFLIVGIINTTGIVPTNIVALLREVSSFLILMAIASMGLQINLKEIMKNGVKAMACDFIAFTLISALGLSAIVVFL